MKEEIGQLRLASSLIFHTLSFIFTSIPKTPAARLPALRRNTPAPVQQKPLFENFHTGGFDLGDLAVKIVGVDGDVFESHELLELLFFEKLRHVQLDAV